MLGPSHVRYIDAVYCDGRFSFLIPAAHSSVMDAHLIEGAKGTITKA